MNNSLLGFCVALCVLFIQCSFKNGKETSLDSGNDTVGINSRNILVKIPIGVKSLMTAYPNYVVGYKDGYLLLADSSKLLFDDKSKKTFEEKMDNADPEDMFCFKYDINSETPDYLQDAGRSRCEQLFKLMYGNNENEVRKNLVDVDWFGATVAFSKINGASDSLKSVAKEIETHPELKPYLKSSGTFYWRKVRGANRLSAHSYGIAIDVGVSYSDYWLWKNKGKSETDTILYANRMPRSLTEIFERHGFIWGGRWYHYDTMHFEFRPEILSGCI